VKLSEPLAGLAGLRDEIRTVYLPDTKYQIVSTQSWCQSMSSMSVALVL